jgi:RHS repeat-associated protein
MRRKLVSLAWFVCGSSLALACTKRDEGQTSGDRERARAEVHVEPSAQALTGPTTVTLLASADTHIAQTSPTFNYGTASALEVTGTALSSWEATLIKFDSAALQTALASGTLASARIELNVSSTSLGFGNSQVNIHRMLVPWTESGATWLCANDTSTSGLGLFVNNCTSANSWGIEWWSLLPRPYAATPAATANVPFGQQGVVSVDVTQDLKSLGSATHQGFFLTAAAGFSSVWIRFASRQSSTPPKLVLTITPSCTATGPDTNCNGIDDDCNGTIDDGFASTPTGCGVGACARTGATSCVAGVVRNSCVAGSPAASDSTCNGADDNCNGQTDEGYAGAPTSCGVGACADTGTMVCNQGVESSNCAPKQPLASDDKTCDGIDDDCSGQADEDYVAVATSCGVGACGNQGLSACVAGMVQANCTPKPPLSSTDTTCDGVDDNCNGQADESYVSTATSCGVGACARSGVSMCVAGMAVPGCVPGQPSASDATCDGVDDNCDGTADEGYVATQTDCENAGCLRHGHLSCLTGHAVNDCETSGVCYAESDCSDGIDNDADGHSDCNDSDCAGKASCVPEICDNDLDDDGDGDFDCADPDCAAFAVCNDIPSEPASVAPPLNGAVATAYNASLGFLYTGAAPIQKGVAAGTIAPNRASLITGIITDVDLQPLPAVRIAVLNHPELGWTNTREDGRFDMVVNAGGLLTVTMTLPGYLSAQRQIQTDWNQPTRLPTVVLTQLDPVASNVDVSGTVGMQAARGGPALDQDGVRTGTLLFPSGVQATLTGADGTPVSQSQLAIRITEYTVGANGGQQMPAELPPNSAYTYAMDLSADGLRSAEFSKPLPYYLENFLGFPTGTSLPLGFYDTNQGRWIAQDSGVVVKFLGLTGTLAALDVTGDNVADDAMTLARYGISAEEQAFLPSLYAVGASLWRVQVKHFSSYDINQGIVPDPNAQFPNATAHAPPVPPGHKPQCSASGSRIACQTQSLGEDIPVPGTPYALHYNSELLPGRTDTIDLKLGTADRLNAAALELVTAEFTPKYGSMTRYAFCKGQVPNAISWKWSGLDDYGRRISGTIPVQITIRYFYKSYYGQTSRFGYNGQGKISTDQNFRRGSGEALVASLCGGQQNGSLAAAAAAAAGGGGYAVGAAAPMMPVAGYVSLRQDLTSTLSSFDSVANGIGGFTITPHHSYDPEGHTLTMGDGTRFEAQSMPNVAYRRFTFPNPSTRRFIGRTKMAALPDGTLYVQGSKPNEGSGVVKLSPTNEFNLAAKMVVGTDCAGTSNTNWNISGFEGARVDNTLFCTIVSFALSPEGELYIVDSGRRAIFRVDKQGIIHIFAGNGGAAGGAPDGGPANASNIGFPRDVEVAPDGKVYFITHGGNTDQIRFVDTDGRLGTLAGRASNDPLPFSQTRAAQFVFDSTLDTLSVEPDGSVIFSEQARRVGRVKVDGSISVYPNLTGPADITNAVPGYVQFLDYDGASKFVSVANGTVVPFVSQSGPCTGQNNVPLCPPRPDGTIAASPGFNNLNGGARVSPAHSYVHDRVTIYDIAPASATQTDVLTVPSPDGSQLFLFDYTGRHLETRSGLTKATIAAFGYDTAGRLTSVTDEANKLTQIVRDVSGTPTAIVAPFGQRTELGTNSAGLISQIQPDPTQPPYLFTYVGHEGLLQSMTDPRGGVHTFTFDDGRLASDQAPDGRIMTLARTEASDVTTVNVSETEGGTKSFVTDLSQSGKLVFQVTYPDGSRGQSTQTPDGVTTTIVADGSTVVSTTSAHPVYGTFAPVTSRTLTTPSGLRRVESTTVSVTAPANAIYDWTQRITTTNVNNRIGVATFDRASRTDTRVTPAGRTSTTVFDSLGRLSQRTTPGRAPVVLEYDDAGHLKQMTQGTRGRQFAFDLQTGFLQSESVLGLNEVTRYTRDDVGRTVQSTDPDSQVTNFAYDELGSMGELTPPGRAAHLMSYTPAQLLSSYTAPSGVQGGLPAVTQFDYTKHRRSKLLTRADGRTIQSTYRSDGKLATVVSPRGTSSFTYNAITGLVTGISDVDGGAVTFAYDGSLPTSVSWSGSARPSGTVAITYDANHWLDLLKVNGTTVADYSYDNDGLIVGTAAMTITRSAPTADITATSLDGVSTTQSTNAYGEVDDLSVSQSMNTLYREQVSARDPSGRVTERVETIAGTSTTYGYSYDLAGRLSDVKINGIQSAHYDYDSNGNRSARTTTASSQNGSYDGQDRLTSYGSTTYSYLPSGQLSSKTSSAGTTTYDYDVFGNLRSVALPDGRALTYEIDAQQRRIGKRLGGARQYGLLYQTQLAPVAMLDASNAVIATFVYATRHNVPDYMVKSGQRYRIVSDARGSVRLVVRSSDGTIVQRLDYDEFGVVLSDTNPGFQPFGFAGGLYDADSGLVRFGARDYDAVTGRWTAKDPILFGGGQSNLYVYVNSDPVNLSDPEGTGVVAAGAVIAACTAWEIYNGISTVSGLRDLRNEIDDVDDELAQLRGGSFESICDNSDQIDDLNKKREKLLRDYTEGQLKGWGAGLGIGILCSAATALAFASNPF